MTAGSLIVRKKEQLVLDDRTTDRPTELVPIAAWDTSLIQSLSKGVFRKVGVRALEIKDRTMEIVAAGFCLRCDHRADGLTELSIVIL